MFFSFAVQSEAARAARKEKISNHRWVTFQSAILHATDPDEKRKKKKEKHHSPL